MCYELDAQGIVKIVVLNAHTFKLSCAPAIIVYATENCESHLNRRLTDLITNELSSTGMHFSKGNFDALYVHSLDLFREKTAWVASSAKIFPEHFMTHSSWTIPELGYKE